jgi:hypothetical protein
MLRFSKSELLRLPDSLRAERCRELACTLAERLKEAENFHAIVVSLVSALRAVGHDLWSFDESDDVEVWGPNYEKPSGPGIVVTFRPDEVIVEWTLE